MYPEETAANRHDDPSEMGHDRPAPHRRHDPSQGKGRETPEPGPDNHGGAGLNRHETPDPEGELFPRPGPAPVHGDPVTDAIMDEASDESFPTSDPPAHARDIHPDQKAMREPAPFRADVMDEVRRRCAQAADKRRRSRLAGPAADEEAGG